MQHKAAANSLRGYFWVYFADAISYLFQLQYFIWRYESPSRQKPSKNIPRHPLVQRKTNLDIRMQQSSTGVLVVVKEFTLNRCPFQEAGQMMTPDREPCYGVMSRPVP
jgi:hypothetical protein